MGLIGITCIKPPCGHYDFNLRMNEIACVVSGVNPFLVWNGDVVLRPYVSNLPKSTVQEGCTEPVNAYAPWEYSYMMPLVLLPRSVAWSVYSLLMLLAMILILRFSMPETFHDGCRADTVLTTAVPFVVVSYLLWSNASVGNFIVIVLASSVLLARFLNEGRWCIAGVLWSIAMIKPQSALLFAVPLLMRGRWMVCITAGLTCLAASIPPSILCRSSLLEMLIQGPAANAELFEGCGTWPKFLCGHLGSGADIGLGLAIGAALCVWMTWMLRRERDWLVYLMPAAICGSCWTYTQAYSHAMGWFVAFAIVSALVRNPKSRFLWVLFALSLPVLSRAFLAWHGLCAFFGWEFPISGYAFRCVDSLNSTASLAIAFSFCAWRRRELECGIIRTTDT